MIARMSYLACDRCGNPGPFGDSPKECRAEGRREGWVRVSVDHGRRHEDLCSRCRSLDTDGEAT